MKSFRIISFLFLILAFSSTVKIARADSTPEVSKVVKDEAEKMGQAFLTQDYKTAVDYTYPKVIEMNGGSEKMVELLKTGMADADLQSIKFGEPSDIIQSGDELQCTISQEMVLKLEQGKFISNSTLIAISSDNGKTWHFINTMGDIASMKEILPNLSDKLIIPVQTSPVAVQE